VDGDFEVDGVVVGGGLDGVGFEDGVLGGRKLSFWCRRGRKGEAKGVIAYNGQNTVATILAGAMGWTLYSHSRPDLSALLWNDGEADFGVVQTHPCDVAERCKRCGKLWKVWSDQARPLGCLRGHTGEGDCIVDCCLESHYVMLYMLLIAEAYLINFRRRLPLDIGVGKD